MLKKLFFIFPLLLIESLVAQNTPVTQYYGSPLLLNPGLTGTTEEFRANIVYRGQVSQGGFGNLSNLFAVDYNIPENGISVGLMVSQLVQTEINQRSTQLSGLISYEINLSESWKVRPGIRFSYGRRDINFSNNNYYIPYTPSQSPNADNVTYLTADAGGILYNESFWFGASFYNLNQPDISIFSDIDEQLGVTSNIHTGYRYTLDEIKEQYVTLALNYTEVIDQRAVYDFNQIDIGLYYTSGIGQIGAWYRGLSTRRNDVFNYTVPHNMVAMAAIHTNGFQFGYSYEFRVRGTGFANFHELSLALHFNAKKGDIKSERFPSPMPWI